MKTLILTGGGSAGHVVPHLALLPDLRRNYALAYIGTDGIERELLQNTGIPFYSIRAPKLVRGSVTANLTLPARLLRSVHDAKRALRAAKADAVFSKGGYVALPVVLAARALHLPVLTHESDRTPGLANKLIARRCNAVLTSFPETARAFKNGIYTGSPVREELLRGDRENALHKYGFSGKRTILLAFGGGSGSRALNEALENALPRLLLDLDVLHIRGPQGTPPTLPPGIPGRYCPLSYETDMASAYACADLVLARAGANTLFELLALRKRALLVPLGNKRSRGDQAENANYFARKGLCRVLRERDLTPERLTDEIYALRRDSALDRRLQDCDCTDGNRAVLEHIRSLFPASPQNV